MSEGFNTQFQALGGLDKLDEFIALDDYDRTDFIEIYGIEDHTEFIDFILNFGGHTFAKEVVCTSIKDVPSFPSGKAPLFVIFGFIEGSFGIAEINDLIEDNLPPGYIAFAMGNPTGDYWVYEIATKKVLLWIHDEPEDDCLFPAADSLTNFLLNCEIDESDNSNQTTDGDFVVGPFVDDYFD